MPLFHLHSSPRVRRAHVKSAGTSPGSLVHVGAPRSSVSEFRIVRYSPERLEESVHESLPPPPEGAEEITWITLTGIHDVEKVAALGGRFRVPALVLEDVLNTDGRLKLEDLGEALFLVCRLLYRQGEEKRVQSQQCSLLLLPRTVLLFLEEPCPVFDPVLARLRQPGGRLRTMGADYLAWALLDTVVDHQFTVIDVFEQKLLDLDDRLLDDAFHVPARELHDFRRSFLELYSVVRPMRETVTALQRTESPLLTPPMRPFFSDLFDHVQHAQESIDHLRDLAAGLRDYQAAAVSNRMNEVMKVLTCFSAMFLPLSFLAAVYGMNFHHMPELAHPWAYPLLWVVFLVVSAGMFLFFRRRGWL